MFFGSYAATATRRNHKELQGIVRTLEFLSRCKEVALSLGKQGSRFMDKVNEEIKLD